MLVKAILADAKNYEVLIATDPAKEFALQRLSLNPELGFIVWNWI